MSFDWTEFLHLAKELAGRGKTAPAQEAKLRSAISRAYYAAYCKARNQLGPIPIHVQNKHTYVWNYFQNSRDPTLKEIGKDGRRLRLDRNRADYDNSIANLSSLTLADLILSESIIARLL